MISGVHGTYVTCSGTTEEPCSTGVFGPFEGVTGTPVIDMQTNPYTLYVVAAVSFGQSTTCQNSNSICFYLFAVDIRTGDITSKQLISAVVNGFSPDPDGHNHTGVCTSTLPHSGQITFEYHHPQRSALLLLPNGTVYVAFASGLGESNNGWIFAYTLNNGTLTQTNRFNSTPYGTGGGIWQSGGGPAYDGSHIYANSANGTLFDALQQLIPDDIGDSLLQLDPSTLTVTDFYSPYDAFSYGNGTGLCINDEDFGSGGVLTVPTPFTYNSMSVVITADKQSNLYVSDRGNLGKFSPSSGANCPSTPNNIQCITTPHNAQHQKLATSQGYWGSPAYWHYNDGQDHYMLYYSATTEREPTKAPYPINGYNLVTGGTSGPIPDPPTASTSVLFCERSPTPSGSWDGSDPKSGILWAIEHQNANNPNHVPINCDGGNTPPTYAALHAFKATDLTATELYNSRQGNLNTPIGDPTKFSPPTVFKSRVYVGTQTEVDVYGLCASQQGGCKP